MADAGDDMVGSDHDQDQDQDQDQDKDQDHEPGHYQAHVRGGISLLAINEAKSLLALSHDKYFRLFQTSDGKTVMAEDLEAPIRIFGFSPDGKVLVTGSDDKKLMLWSCDTFRKIAERIVPKKPTAFAFVKVDPLQIVVSNKAGDVFTFDFDLSTLAAAPEPASATSTPPTLRFGHYSIITHLITFQHGNIHCIATCDRDEKIRVTQSNPDFLEIQSFCLAHTEFVSRVCAPKTNPWILLSGGGDRTLRVWNHLTGKLLLTHNFVKSQAEHARDHEEDLLHAADKPRQRDTDETSVSVLVADDNNISSNNTTLIVACLEGVKELQVFNLTVSQGQTTSSSAEPQQQQQQHISLDTLVSVPTCHPLTSAQFLGNRLWTACVCGHTCVWDTATWKEITGDSEPLLAYIASHNTANPRFVSLPTQTALLAPLILPDFRRKFASRDDFNEFQEHVENRILHKKTRQHGEPKKEMQRGKKRAKHQD